MDLYQALDCDLDFSEDKNSSRIHNFHSFPAKFPPGIPAKMIEDLTNPGDVVLDPMCGSGTTLVEAVIANRVAVGFDIDPLAILLSTVKTTKYNASDLLEALDIIIYNASKASTENLNQISDNLEKRWDTQTREFVNYWFTPQTQIELCSLILEIEKLQEPQIKNFFKLVFSSIIITKSGGVSLALDLAHTRPHKAKGYSQKQSRIFNYSFVQESIEKPYLSKVIKPAINEFKKRALVNIQSTEDFPVQYEKSEILMGDARSLKINDNSVNLIVTSPPYASNAIDYIRAHKFSLVWLGYSISALSATRREYIGAEALSSFQGEEIVSPTAKEVIEEISEIDKKKASDISKYYQESEVLISEMHRVLKQGGNAVYVVGTSKIKGIDIQIANCLGEIGESVGFQVPKITLRKINRDKRMLPVSKIANSESQIEQRMLEEFVIGFHKE